MDENRPVNTPISAPTEPSGMKLSRNLLSGTRCETKASALNRLTSNGMTREARMSASIFITSQIRFHRAGTAPAAVEHLISPAVQGPGEVSCKRSQGSETSVLKLGQ